jgi:16S rRNA (guanine527-N7)-methyltransferase
MPEMNKLLVSALKENNMSVPAAEQQKLVSYLALMLKWNKVFNLTSITDPRDMVYLHIIDSLAVNPFLHGKRLLDVGTGAGLPGIPLAIMNPDQHWVLLDKNSKKTRFLTQTAAELKLTNVEAVHSRSEDFHTSHCFDSILSRALGTIHMFAESTRHLLCPDGMLIAMKGKYPQEELDDLPVNFTVKDITRLDIKGMDIERHIVRINKREHSG